MKLNDRYTAERGSVYLTGIQALVRLPMDQMRRDRRAGLNTASFISGYEGSPLGGYDLALNRVRSLLDEHRIHFVPGVNEDLAATSVMGSQIVHVLGESKYDGVLGIWYGKGPGVDRSGDIFRHANLAGTGPNCAALALGGDDHISKSSTIPHQSDFSFYNVGMPTFYPGSIQEILDHGHLAIALSRWSGAWCAMKMVTNVCDGGGTAGVDPERLSIALPGGYEKHHDARLVVPFTLALEHEVNVRRLDAAREFARLNRVNTWFGAKDAWLGIATAGKPYYDLIQALRDLGIRLEDLDELGIRIAKYAMTFPVEPEFSREFSTGLQTLFVVEEKRSFLELQLREALYNLPSRPVIIGKHDASGAPLLPPVMELDPEPIAKILARLLTGHGRPSIEARLRLMEEIQSRGKRNAAPRPPNFCSGCPHNRSTIVLEGQVSGGGIGCHAMAANLAHTGRGYAFLTQMGGEGAPWIGMAPFVERSHMFQNVGDGTYFHSGAMAVTAAVASGINITYRILYNSAVAMTGGQQASGALSVPDLTRKLEAEGVKRTVVVTDNVPKYKGIVLASNAAVRDRDELPETMRDLEKVTGVTVIVYDQQCAAEKRRERARGIQEEPALRVVINEEVCEGCGDCVRQSNCMSLYPVQTEFGPKTRIHQSSCNKDYSCVLGDCPSFMTVNLKPGSGLRKREAPVLPAADVPQPREIVDIGESYSILLPGIGGTGVLTINALLATAASIDGLFVLTLDQTGLAQKGGAVLSSIVLSRKPVDAPSKVGYGNADLILGFDLLGAAGGETLKSAHPSRTVAVVNTAEIPTGSAIRGKLEVIGPARQVDLVNENTRPGRNVFVDATRLAEGLFANHLATNVFLLGVAWQAGLIPITAAAIEEAIRLNKVDAERNSQAFLWGRKYYHDAAAVEALVSPRTPVREVANTVERRAAELRLYQNDRYAGAYEAFVSGVAARAASLVDPVARNLYKLMAYKDEYEVARLLTKPAVAEQIAGMWETVESIGYNLHPPILRALGWKKKLKLGQWFGGPLRALAAMKGLRGTVFDVFGYADIRREERALVEWYRELVTRLLDEITPENELLAIEIASLPGEIRGYENIKMANIAKVKAIAEEKLALLRAAAAQAR